MNLDELKIKKRCTRCKVYKEFDQFHKTSRKYQSMETRKWVTYYYHHSVCRDCRNEAKREYDAKKRRRKDG
jgi:hypothetical protein